MNNRLSRRHLTQCCGSDCCHQCSRSTDGVCHRAGRILRWNYDRIESTRSAGASLHWLVITAVIILAVSGLYFLFQLQKE